MIKITNIETLENKQRELVSNLTVEELEVYINKLTENYFVSFLNDDKDSYLHTANQLKELTSFFINEYPNLNGFINFSLVAAINKLLSNNLKNDFKPVNVCEVTIEEATVNNGLQSLLKAFNKNKEQWQRDRQNERRVAELEKENRRLKQLLDENNIAF